MKDSITKRKKLALWYLLISGGLTAYTFAQLEEKPEPPKTAPPVAVTGANGKVVNFLGIKAAHPKGLTVQLVVDGPIVPIVWEKLDLEILKQDRPHIYAAYELATKEGQVTDLNLGIFEDVSEKKSKKILDGHYTNSVSGMKFAIQMPAGKPKGVLILLTDLRGESTKHLPRGFDNASHFSELRTTYRLAVMAFDAPKTIDLAQDAVDPLVFADKRSGEATLKAIELFAKDSGQLDLTNAPILLYGIGKTGAAFAYNFTQWKPDRVVAAIGSNGAFYSHTPTEESAKVPFLFLWGQYNDNPERWSATNTHQEISKTHAGLKPNWINAMEFRGKDDSSREHDYFAREFLKKMIDLRNPTAIEKPKEEEKEEPEKEGEEPKKPEPPEPKKYQFSDIPRENSFVGDTKTFETKKIGDPSAPLEEGQTWLPDADFAKMWKAFALGELEPPIPKGN